MARVTSHPRVRVGQLGFVLFGGAPGCSVFEQSLRKTGCLAIVLIALCNRVNYLYDLPMGKGRPFLSHSPALDWIIGGWQIGGITTIATGTPFSPSFTSNIQGSPSGRPDVVADWHVSDRDINRWFNAGAFAIPAPFTFGNAGKNILTGPGLVNFDVSLYKNFKFAERMNLQFRSEFFNIFNHANFANPAANISIPAQVARITSTSTANRVIQFGLRLTF